MSVARVLLFAAALAFAVLRIAGARSPAFQGFAHLYVGGLFGAWAAGAGRYPLWLGIGLSLVELACFLLLPK